MFLVKGRLKLQPPFFSTGYGGMKNKGFLTDGFPPCRPLAFWSSCETKQGRSMWRRVNIGITINKWQPLCKQMDWPFAIYSKDGGLIFSADKLAVEHWLEAVRLLYRLMRKDGRLSFLSRARSLRLSFIFLSILSCSVSSCSPPACLGCHDNGALPWRW